VRILISILAAVLTGVGAPRAFAADAGQAEPPAAEQRPGFVAVINMNMMILPGTQSHLEHAINRAAAEGAKALVVALDTPGGVLQTTQYMVQAIFSSPVPVMVYVSPSGASAASAGVFITLAAHVAAMAPGTSMGAAHPVSGTGANIESDMRTKAENITVAMMKSISEQRGRNAEWAEKSVRESTSFTPAEAIDKKLVDFIASDIDELLRKAAGKQVLMGASPTVLGDYSALPRVRYEMQFKDKVVNVLANPNVAALLWLGATTGLTLELYNPGAIVPGVVGIICLLLALGVSQVLPISSAGVMLIIVGALLIATEMYAASGVLGLGGVVAMVFGVIYLIDESLAPGLTVTLWFVIPLAAVFGAFVLLAMREVSSAYRRRRATGQEGMVGCRGTAIEPVTDEEGRVYVNGEYWRAVRSRDETGAIEKDAPVEVTGMRCGLVLEGRRAAG